MWHNGQMDYSQWVKTVAKPLEDKIKRERQKKELLASTTNRQALKVIKLDKER